LANWSIKSLTAFATRNGGAETAALLRKQKFLVIGNSLRYSDRSFIADSGGFETFSKIFAKSGRKQ
jgi:hypothetical protein